MVDLAQHYNEGPIQVGAISKRQDISVKYLEQLIIPLKEGHFIKSVRGPKGGHMLARPPDDIFIGQIAEVLEGGINLSGCIDNRDGCGKSADCLTQGIWKSATKAMQDKLNSITLADAVSGSCKP